MSARCTATASRCVKLNAAKPYAGAVLPSGRALAGEGYRHLGLAEPEGLRQLTLLAAEEDDA